MDPSAASPNATDAFLLRCYVREGSEAAFRALAERHLPLVWNVARRVVNGDAALAEDVSQIVLADFARKASALPPDIVTAAWLHRHTVFTASKAVRSEVRRRAREQISAENETADHMNTHSESWADVSPHIDAALDRLAPADRSAVILRYFEQRPLREVGQAIGLTEEAARKRIERALTKLRSHLKRRGVVPAAVILAGMLRENSTAAPSSTLGQRILSGAWNRVETGAWSAEVALTPRWRRRGMLAGAAVFFAVAMLWFVLSNNAGTQAPSRSTELRPALPAEKAKSRTAAVALSVKLIATVITLPEKSVAARMLRFEEGRDDSVLYRALLPQAETLQKQINPDGVYGTAGMPLVVLSGDAAVKQMPVRPPLPAPGESPVAESTVEPADPFAGPEGGFPQPDPFGPADNPALTPPSLHVKRTKEFLYATEWPYDIESGLVTAGDFTPRNAGTVLDANVHRTGRDGDFLVECEVDHMLEPGFEEWPYRWPQSEEPASEKQKEAAKIRQPRICDIKLKASLTLSATGEPVLAAMTTASPGQAGDRIREPQRTFLFLKLQL